MKKETMNKSMQFALIAAVFTMAMPGLAIGQDMSSVITDVGTTQLSVIPWILTIVCYIMGAFFMVKGALKLKKHAENPSGQDTVGQGVANLAAGAALAAIPMFQGIIFRTSKMSGDEQGWQAFQTTFN
ncbi:MAG: hypothetical protein FWF24_00760 [Alphaproteobacteria bacterium]|nr:hypothetical protein [Alphaproteobacteria bacterium]